MRLAATCAARLLLLFALARCVSSQMAKASGVADNLLVEQDRLAEDLLRDYHRQIRPICDKQISATRITIGAALRQIIELDDVNQVLTTNVWVHMNWSDCRLTWNASSYANINQLVYPASKIWTPDIVVHGSMGDSFHQLLPNYMSRIFNKGSVNLFVPARLQTICKLDITDFPFDRQRCEIQFGSMVHTEQEIRLQKDSHSPESELNFYRQNGEWTLISYAVKQSAFKDPCCSENFTTVAIQLYLERRPFYYLFNLGFPVLLEMLLVSLSFLLPIESGEKITLGITVMLSLSVFLLVVSKMTPTTSETLPLIGMCFGIIMVLVCLNCMGNVLVLNIFFQPQDAVPPRWLRTLAINYLAPIVRTRRKFKLLAAKMQQPEPDWAPKRSDELERIGNRLASHLSRGSVSGPRPPSGEASAPPSRPASIAAPPAASKQTPVMRARKPTLDQTNSPASNRRHTLPPSILTTKFRNSAPLYSTLPERGASAECANIFNIASTVQQPEQQPAPLTYIEGTPIQSEDKMLSNVEWQTIAITMDRFFTLLIFLSFIAMILLITINVLQEDGQTHDA